MKTFNKEELEKAIEKINGVEWFLNKGIVSYGTSKDNVCIHYLLWHSLNDSGKVKFVKGLFFHLQTKTALEGQKKPEKLRIMIDYGEELNEYERMGIMLHSIFVPDKGFLPCD